MKKIICLLILVLNLIPAIKKGKFCFIIPEANAQYSPAPTNGTSNYNTAGGNVFHTNGSFWYNRGDSYNYSFTGAGDFYYYDNDGHLLGNAILQDCTTCGDPPVGGNGGGGGGGGYGEEEDGGGDPGDGGQDQDGGTENNPQDHHVEIRIDCSGRINGQAFWNDCGECVGGNTGLVDTCNASSTPNSGLAYFITLNNYATKYYKDDTIYVPRSNMPITLTIRNEGGPLVADEMRWRRGNTVSCPAMDHCQFSVSNLGVTKIHVDSATIKLLTRNPLVVYDPPSVYFQRGLNYEGRYGFDDSAYKYLKDSIRYQAGYQRITVHKDTSYIIPWMSVLDQHSATIKIKIKGGDSLRTIKDVNSEAIFKGSVADIKINNGNTFTRKYKDLYTIDTLQIKALEWNNRADSLKLIGNITIEGVDNDLLGKLAVSCAKPVVKKLFFVYVNTGTGYRNISKTAFLDSVNTLGHNQLFRQWELYTPTQKLINDFGSTVVQGMDTLNATSEFSTNNATFMDDKKVVNYLESLYRAHKADMSMQYDVNADIDVRTNDPRKIHFVFIFNYVLPISVVASTQVGKFISAEFADSYSEDWIHELGHILNLNHTFPEQDTLNNGTIIFHPNYNILQYSTGNYMDYTKYISDPPKDMLYYAQWVTVF